MKKLLAIIAIISVLALLIGAISFYLNEFSDFKDLLAKGLGSFKNIGDYPIYDWVKNTTDNVITFVGDIFYNVNYIIKNMF